MFNVSIQDASRPDSFMPDGVDQHGATAASILNRPFTLAGRLQHCDLYTPGSGSDEEVIAEYGILILCCDRTQFVLLRRASAHSYKTITKCGRGSGGRSAWLARSWVLGPW
jgi:hypothetical protein